MCGSEVSEGVEVMEGDRRKTEESRRGGGGKHCEDVVMQIRNFCMFQIGDKAR